jgi:hypothetical protein
MKLLYDTKKLNTKIINLSILFSFFLVIPIIFTFSEGFKLIFILPLIVSLVVLILLLHLFKVKTRHPYIMICDNETLIDYSRIINYNKPIKIKDIESITIKPNHELIIKLRNIKRSRISLLNQIRGYNIHLSPYLTKTESYNKLTIELLKKVNS